MEENKKFETIAAQNEVDLNIIKNLNHIFIDYDDSEYIPNICEVYTSMSNNLIKNIKEISDNHKVKEMESLVSEIKTLKYQIDEQDKLLHRIYEFQTM